MKQVVVNGGETYGDLLTPKYIVEYLKRKGINVYCYLLKVGLENKFEYTLTDPNILNDNTECYTCVYLTENVGEYFGENEEDHLITNDNTINIMDLFDNREDQDLIDIANEINNKDLIKVINIPDDVDYYIKESECGFSECVEEKHRVWWD